MSAATPVRDGHVHRVGVRSFSWVCRDGDPTTVLPLPDLITQSRAPQALKPFLARSHRVVVSNPPENDLSCGPVSVDEGDQRDGSTAEW